MIGHTFRLAARLIAVCPQSENRARTAETLAGPWRGGEGGGDGSELEIAQRGIIRECESFSRDALGRKRSYVRHSLAITRSRARARARECRKVCEAASKLMEELLWSVFLSTWPLESNCSIAFAIKCVYPAVRRFPARISAISALRLAATFHFRYLPITGERFFLF